MAQVETTLIDKLFLELSQFTKAKTKTNAMLEFVGSLLEQKGNYELPDGYSLSKTSSIGWCMYFRSKHVDIEYARVRGLPEPLDRELKSYQTALEAILDWERVKALLR